MKQARELIIQHNQQAVTSSLDVAETFNKKHQHVLRDIDELREGVQKWTDLFFETTYTHEQNKQQYRQYLMNRDGFTLLAMGFTGKEALQFKLKYIEAFNEMERQINKPMSGPELALLQAQNLVNLEKRVDQQEEKLDNITDILSIGNQDWRNQANKIINAIANKLGGGQYYQEIRNESYELLEQRAACSLGRRLQNRQQKMALRGASKTAIRKLNVLDVIAEDKKLVSVYVTVIKELGVKYQLNPTEYQFISEEEII